MSNQKQTIPRYIIEELNAFIGEKTLDKLVRYVLPDTENKETAIDHYIEYKINDFIFSSDEVNDLAELQRSFYRRILLTKKNWNKQLKKEVEEKPGDNSIKKELEVLNGILESKGFDENITDALQEVRDPVAYINKRLEDVEAWAADKKSRLTDFPFLGAKKQFQIEKAFENDIVYLICSFLKNAPRNWFSVRVNDLIEYPVFADGQKKMEGKVMVDSTTNSTNIEDEYRLSDNRIFRQLISVEEGEEMKLNKAFLLDGIDSEILEFALEQRDKRFYSQKTIVLDLSPLVKKIYNNTSSKAYDLITNRLEKLGRVRLEGKTIGKNNKVNTVFLYNLFDYVKVIRRETAGRGYAELKFTDTLHQQFITNQTVEIYSHYIHRLENKISKILIYAFQKERLDAHLEGREMKGEFDYHFFSDRIRFRSKNIETNLGLISASLKEFKEANILIEDFQKIGYGFEISLTPLTNAEKIDFFSRDNIGTEGE